FSLVGAVGDDTAGSSLVENLNAAGVDCRGVIVVPGQQTTTKVRVLAGHLHSPRQQVIRIDYDNAPASGADVTQQMVAQFKTVAGDVDAVVISDYNYGVASEAITAVIRDLARDREIPVLVDSRHRLLHFREFATATPNEDEVEQLLNRNFDQVEELETACSLLREELGCQALLVTRGNNGMILLQKGEPAQRIEAVGSRQPIDVTGAGDTVIAAYALALASGASFEDAAQIANHAGGVVVMKRGTATLSAQELTNSINGERPGHD
ncbi:MAG: PfkB family carbohydrate kinase, partial [Pyrinomonadaceae bacterium]